MVEAGVALLFFISTIDTQGKKKGKGHKKGKRRAAKKRSTGVQHAPAEPIGFFFFGSDYQKNSFHLLFFFFFRAKE